MNSLPITSNSSVPGVPPISFPKPESSNPPTSVPSPPPSGEPIPEPTTPAQSGVFDITVGMLRQSSGGINCAEITDEETALGRLLARAEKNAKGPTTRRIAWYC